MVHSLNGVHDVRHVSRRVEDCTGDLEKLKLAAQCVQRS